VSTPSRGLLRPCPRLRWDFRPSILLINDFTRTLSPTNWHERLKSADPVRILASVLSGSLLLSAMLLQEALAEDFPKSLILARCVLIAADPNDSTTIGAGVWPYELNTTAAEDACQQAHTADQTDVRTIYLLGRIALERRDYASAKSSFESAARLGYISALARLGDMYFRGISVPKDEVKAMDFFEKASAEGDPYSKATLSMMILARDPVDQAELERARELAEQSAALGSPDGYFALGMMHLRGLAGLEKSAPDAIVDLLKAAHMGLLDAQFVAGQLMVHSNDKEVVRAGIEWLRSAASRGHKRSIALLNSLHRLRVGQ